MIPLQLVMTTAGLGKFSAAQSDNGVDLTVTQVGFTAAEFIAAPSLTGLPGEFRRVATVAGETVGENIVHMTVQDDAALCYMVRGFGLFLGDGTLFATYSQAAVIAEKSASSMLALVLDLVFSQAGVENITFGDTNFLNPPATADRKGVVELATLTEAEAGDVARVTTGAVVRAMIYNALAMVIEALDGLIARTITGRGLVKGGGSLGSNISLNVDAAGSADIVAGTRSDLAVTPAALAEARMLRIVSSSLTANGGYRIHSDGFVEQWGVAASRTTEGQFTLDFPIAFPSECFGVSAMTLNTNQTTEGQTSIQEVGLYADRAVLFAQNHTASLTETGGFRWRAWGK